MSFRYPDGWIEKEARMPSTLVLLRPADGSMESVNVNRFEAPEARGLLEAELVELRKRSHHRDFFEKMFSSMSGDPQIGECWRGFIGQMDAGFADLTLTAYYNDEPYKLQYVVGATYAYESRITLSCTAAEHEGEAVRGVFDSIRNTMAFTRPHDASTNTLSRWRTVWIDDAYSFQVPASWVTLADPTLTEVNKYVDGLGSSDPRGATYRKVITYQANLLTDTGDSVGQVQVRQFPDGAVSQATVGLMSSSDIAIADQGIRRAFEEDVARSQSAADPALRFALVSWEGTALQEFNGVHALVTKYVRTNYPHSANMHIQRINIQDGPHSFSMFLSMRADRLATLQPVIDDIVVSLTRAASSPAAPVPPTAPARDVVSEGLKSPATDAFGLSAWLLVWAAVLVVFAAVYLIKNQ